MQNHIKIGPKMEPKPIKKRTWTCHHFLFLQIHHPKMMNNDLIKLQTHLKALQRGIKITKLHLFKHVSKSCHENAPNIDQQALKTVMS